MANNIRKIRDLTERELVSLIQETIKGNYNFIEVSGIQVNSTTENLKEVEETVNRLLNKHKNFLLLKKELKVTTGLDIG